MATNDEDKPGEEAMTEEERRKRALALSQEIAQRWEPSRLSKFVVGGAGKGEKLDLGTQSEMERRLGGRFGDVRGFRGPFAGAGAQGPRAAAVTLAHTRMTPRARGPA